MNGRRGVRGLEGSNIFVSSPAFPSLTSPAPSSRPMSTASHTHLVHKWMAKRAWLLHETGSEWSTGNSLVEEVDRFLTDKIGQKNLEDAIKI